MVNYSFSCIKHNEATFVRDTKELIGARCNDFEVASAALIRLVELDSCVVFYIGKLFLHDFSLKVGHKNRHIEQEQFSSSAGIFNDEGQVHLRDYVDSL